MVVIVRYWCGDGGAAWVVVVIMIINTCVSFLGSPDLPLLFKAFRETKKCYNNEDYSWCINWK